MPFCDAIRNLRELEVHYGGGIRIIEPHCRGVTTAGHGAIRAYQSSGHSESGETSAWKLLLIADLKNVKPTGRTFNGPRSGYKRGDRGMSQIHCEL